MAEFSPTQKLDQLGIVVRKKMAKQRDIGASDLISMAETAEASLLPSEMEIFQEEEFFDLRNEIQPFTRIFSDKEIPEGIRNGSNKRFRLLNPPEFNSEHLFLNGVLQEGDGADYIIHGNVITLKQAPLFTDKLLCTYYYTPFVESFNDVYDPLMFDGEGNYIQEDFFENEVHTLPDEFFQKFDASGSFQIGDEFDPNEEFDFEDFFDFENDDEYYDPLTDPDHPNYNIASDYTHPDYNPIYDPFNHIFKDPLTDPNHPDYDPLSDYTHQDYNPFTDPLNPDFDPQFP